jgi:hypothetical protein
MKNESIVCSTVVLFVLLLGPAGLVAQSGSLERVHVFGPSLEGNLLGAPDSPEVSIYLPPSYEAEPGSSSVRMASISTFETYEGDHGNRIPERFEQKVLGFFSEHLETR